MPVEPLCFDTSDLPDERQFAAWAAHSPNTRLAPLAPGPFRATGRFWQLGSVHIADFVLDPFSSDRTPDLVRAVPADFVQLVALNAGEVRFEHEDGSDPCRAPDLFVRDYARPSRAVSGRIHAITLYVARSYLQLVPGAVVQQGRLPLGPETMVLGSTLRTIVGQLGSAEAAAAGLYARVLRDLFAAALLRRSSARSGRRDQQMDRLCRAKAAIAATTPGALSVEALTRELSMSRSVLFELFRQHGGVLAYDRLRRLRALYRAIADPAEDRPFAELGAEQGFADKSALSRTFKAAFGRSMSEVRADALNSAAERDAPNPVITARSAIALLD